MTEPLNSIDLERKPPSVQALFNFTLTGATTGIYSYSDEGGIVCGAGKAGDCIRFVFLLNAAEGAVATLSHPWGCYAFYLDEKPVKRPAVPRHFQLVHDPALQGASFAQWASTVIKYLSGCFHAPTIPPFDTHEIASVLHNVSSPRLYFRTIPGVAHGELDAALTLVPSCKNLLLVVFSPIDWLCVDELHHFDSVKVCQGGGFVVGGALHPYDERVLMVLGEPDSNARSFVFANSQGVCD
jgi:hypothetical protein